MECGMSRKMRWFMGGRDRRIVTSCELGGPLRVEPPLSPGRVAWIRAPAQTRVRLLSVSRDPRFGNPPCTKIAAQGTIGVVTISLF